MSNSKTIAIITMALMLGCDDSGVRSQSDFSSDVDGVKTNVNSFSATMRDALRSYWNQEVAYDEARGIRLDLTIKRDIQNYLSETIVRMSGTNTAIIGMGVALDLVRDGAILAMSSCGMPTNDFPLACSYAYEPGAVIMPITAALAFDVDLVQPSTAINTDRNEERYYKLPNDGGRTWPATMTIEESVLRSSNICMGKVGHDLGAESLYAGLSAFGFGRGTTLCCQKDNSGFLPRSDRIDKASRSRIPIGMGFSATLLQVARAYAILARNGAYVEPYIVASGTDKHGDRRDVRKYESVAVIKESSAKAVKEILRQIPAANGPVPNAAVAGVDIAGKTGTSLCREGYGYSPDTFSSTFVGFFPASSPKFLVAIAFVSKRESGNVLHQGCGRPAMAFAAVASYLQHRKEESK